MSLNRRTFLQGISLGAIGAWASQVPALAEIAALPAVPAFDPAKEDAFWQSVRALYPLQAEPAYLNTGGLGPTPQPVLDAVFSTMTAMQQHSEPEHELHIEPARHTVAKYLGVEPGEICFVRNATEGNSIVAAGLALKAGDEVIFESHAHPGGSYPWFNRLQKEGIVVRLFEPDQTSAEANLAAIRALVTPRTKVIQVSHITCTLGLIMPVAAIAEYAHAHGIWFHVDGAQSAGMIPVNLHALGCDSYAISGHKWIGGPHETGVFFLRRERLGEVAVTEIGSHAAELPYLPGVLELNPSTVRFEYGTRNLGLITGLAVAADLQEKIGRERIAAHGHALASELLAGLDGIKDIEILSPRDPALRGSMITVRHARLTASKFTDYVKRRHHLRCRPVGEQKIEGMRISTHVFNSHAECVRVIDAVRAAAREF